MSEDERFYEFECQCGCVSGVCKSVQQRKGIEVFREVACPSCFNIFRVKVDEKNNKMILIA